MNWPAPELLPPPEPPVIESDEGEDDRRARSGLPAATWIALLGGALVLVAAASVVVSSWDAIGRSVRVLGLALGTGGMLLGTERLRRVAPSTSNIAAHVGTSLVGSVGIAVLSLFGITWPGCLVAGGAAALAAATWQVDRWRPQLFGVIQVAAIAMASVGAAALTGTTGGVIAALAALVWLLFGAERRPAALAIVAVSTPALTALADAGIGAGTFARAGLVGERLGWSGPVVGLLSSMVLAVVARRRRDDGLMVAAAAAPLLGLVTGLAAIDPSTLAWWCLPAFAVVSAEAAVRMLPSRSARGGWASWCDAVAITVAGASLVAPALVGEFDLGSSLSAPWAVPTALTAFALVLPTTRWRATDRRVVDVGTAALAALTVATVAAFTVPAALLASVAVSATAAAAYTSRRLHRLAIAVPALWSLWAIEPLTSDTGSAAWWCAVALTATTAGIVVAARARLASDDGIAGWAEMIVVVLTAGVFATTFVDGHDRTAVLLGVATMAAAIALVEARWTSLHVGAVATVGLLAAPPDLGTSGADPHAWIGWAAATVGLAAVAIARRSSLAGHAVASSAVVTLAVAGAGAGASAEQAALASMVAVAVLTG
ncbi:MAG: hypothetical protein KDB37_10775, partial [Ilumatobacter sp.]|nr:hypothetical protein [Ilumatobacter sp.]